ncbi:MAG: NAD-dependent epimerase/dehydratase family protein, partial [Candidatus Caenarcaniphilales bacterium]|nr:NAD-dependent epimerase/dehydratase family protein [Candidatus Caenarcaniphilales bacterium]
EKLIQDCGQNKDINYMILRYFNVAGAHPNGKLGQKNKNSSQLIKVCCEAAVGKRDKVEIFGTDYETPDGTGIRDYIHVEDLAAAHLSALEFLEKYHQSQVFNVGYNHGYSVKEVVQAVKKISGSDFKVIESPKRDGDLPMLIANCDKIHNKLAWETKYNNLETIIQHSLAWEKKVS